MGETERDILAETLGFDPETGNRVGVATHRDDKRLIFVRENGNPVPRYSSLEDLTAFWSPWRKYIADPVVLSGSLTIEGGKRSRERRKWIKKTKRARESSKEYIGISDEIKVNTSLSQRALNPDLAMLIMANASPSRMHLRLGEIIGAFQPDPSDILKIANNSPWSQEGGFQTLADVVGKPIIVTTTSHASIEYLPSFEERV